MNLRSVHLGLTCPRIEPQGEMIGKQVVCENVPRTQAQAKRDWLTLTANVLHCLVLRAHRTRESVEEVPFCSLKTAQKKQENLKLGNETFSCTFVSHH